MYLEQFGVGYVVVDKKNTITSLFASERIETTAPKAKEVRRVAERMITFARRGDLAARRHVAKTVQNPDVLKKLFDDIAPRYVDRPGGYTRVLKLGTRRKGDNAPRAILELVGEKDEGRKKKKTPRKKYHKVDIPKAPVRAKKAKEKAAEEKEAEGETAAEKTEEAAAEEKTEVKEKAVSKKADVKAAGAKEAKPGKPKGGKKK